MKKCNKCGRTLFDIETECVCGSTKLISSTVPTKKEQKLREYSGGHKARKPAKNGSGIGKVLCYISAALYPLILIGVCILIYSLDKTSIAGMSIGIVLSALSAVTIFLGGFYMIVVPLPVIFIYKIGCYKSGLQNSKRTLYGALTFLLIIAAVLVMFICS